MNGVDYLTCEMCGRETRRIHNQYEVPSCSSRCDEALNAECDTNRREDRFNGPT